MLGTNRRLILGIVVLLSFILVFLVGRKFNPETGVRSYTVTMSGVSQFRKGLDVAGGTKLVYKISYDKYEEIYTNRAELDAVKKTIETIILQNIDKRISKLGVSDYRAYTQVLNNENYIVVELGGIANLDEAKKQIGKTVELEFRLKNKQEPNAEMVAQRKTLADTIFKDIVSSTGNVEQKYSGRGSDDVYYNTFADSSLDQLPAIYTSYGMALDTMQTGVWFDQVLSGVYHVVPTTDANGGQTTETLQGFTMFRLLDKKQTPKTVITDKDILETAQKRGHEYKQLFSKAIANLAAGSYQYNPETSTVIYNIGEVYSGQAAYDATIYSLTKPSILGKTQQEIASIEAARKIKIDGLQSTLRGGNIESITDLKEVRQGWTSEQDLKMLIPNFVDNQSALQTFQQFDTYYIVTIKDRKSAMDLMSSTIQVSDISTSERPQFETMLKIKTTYTIEDIFVKDRQSRVSAVDQKTNKILNGAYFKFASVGNSQVGKPTVTITFDDQGKELFCNITDANKGEMMAIFVGGQLITSPVIQDKICGGTAQIDGQFDVKGAKELADALNDGTLPAPLFLMQEEKMSPTLGDHALRGALYAGLLGLGLIFLYMLCVYGSKKAGISIAVMIGYGLVLLGFSKLIDYGFSLSGIAAIILSMAMAVDANILIFERIIEERKVGKSMASAIEIGYSRSWAPIRDGNFSTGLIAFVLFMLGMNIFKGFGSMMLINMVIIL